MSNSVLIALAKSVADLREAFAALAREPGLAGKDGKDGTDGKDGVGKPGRDGVDGKDGVGRPGKDGRNGKDGLDGKDGTDGKEGPQGPIGPMPKHQWRGTELRFQIAPQKWGQWVDLRGPKGPGGGSVVVGGTELDPLKLPDAGFVTSEDDILLIRNGVLMRGKLPQSNVPPNAVTVDGVPVTVEGQYVVVN